MLRYLDAQHEKFEARLLSVPQVLIEFRGFYDWRKIHNAQFVWFICCSSICPLVQFGFVPVQVFLNWYRFFWTGTGFFKPVHFYMLILQYIILWYWRGTPVVKVTFSEINVKLAEKNKYATHSVQRSLEMCKNKEKPNISEDFRQKKFYQWCRKVSPVT